MIRGTLVVALTALLILVLYLPSKYPPGSFISQMRDEHVCTAAFWSESNADHILSRTLDAHAKAEQITPVPGNAGEANSVNTAVGREMAQLNGRLFGNAYFRSVDALVLLATYRLFTLIEWLPWLLPFCAVALVDGACSRAIKAKQFDHHDPELFALYVVGAILLICGAMVALVLPIAFPPWALPLLPLLVAILTAGALGHFHQRP
nr:DUF4400 domain-containing protein [uncultured Roseateles sp.]